jgi:hypothetical protein
MLASSRVSVGVPGSAVDIAPKDVDVCLWYLRQGPQRGSQSRGPLYGASTTRNAPFLSPLHPSRKVPGRQALLQVPQGTGLLEKERPISSALSMYSWGLQQGNPLPPQVLFPEFPQSGKPHHQSPSQPYIEVPSRCIGHSLPH